MFDKTDNYRGGVRLEFNRFHVTLEQGGTTLRDDQQAYDSTLNPGNNRKPYFGQTLDLTGLAQAYGIRGDSIYTKGLFTASPVSWVDCLGPVSVQPSGDQRQLHPVQYRQFRVAAVPACSIPANRPWASPMASSRTPAAASASKCVR